MSFSIGAKIHVLLWIALISNCIDAFHLGLLSVCFTEVGSCILRSIVKVTKALGLKIHALDLMIIEWGLVVGIVDI